MTLTIILFILFILVKLHLDVILRFQALLTIQNPKFKIFLYFSFPYAYFPSPP
jgi:hypothetical protein